MPQTHRSSRPRTWYGVISALVAVLAIGVVAWSWQQTPFDSPLVRTGELVPGSTGAPAAGSDSSDGADRSGPQPDTAVSSSFVSWSISNAGKGTLYLLGSAACGSEVCPTLLRSTDNGSSWTTAHVFRGTDTASSSGDDVPRIQPERAVSRVVFLTPQVGFAFGGDLWVTRDRGRTFERIGHSGMTVLDVSVHAGQVTVLTSERCAQARCQGPLVLHRTSGEPGAGLQSVALRELSSPVDDARLVSRGAALFVEPYRVDGAAATEPWRMDRGQLVEMQSPTACGQSPLQSLTSSAAGRLFALCGGDLRGELAEYVLVSSGDGGRTWAPRAGRLLIPRVGRLSLAATDDNHLAAAAGGPRLVGAPTRVPSVAQLLQATDDGGATWNPTAGLLPPPRGLDDVRSPGGTEMYAITRSGAAYWHSADHGRSWTLVDPTQEVPASPSPSPSSSSTKRSATTR